MLRTIKGKWMVATVLAVSLLLGSTPATEVAAAVADLRAMPPVVQQHTRYLSVYNVPLEERDDVMAAVSYTLNAVSRSPLIVRPVWIEESNLIRWSLLAYAPQADDLAMLSAAYEALASEDPYWHLRTEVLDPNTGKRRTVFTDGGWAGLEAAAELRQRTGSGGALLRADWFVAKVSAPSHYYAFANIPKTRQKFFEQLGVDLTTIDRIAADEGANLFRSGVTKKVRRLVRRQGPLGGVWETYDVAFSTPERDPFRNPFDFTYDAGEHIAAKANGLHSFALYNAKGERADSVPDVIAKDDSDPHGDGVLVPMISCVRCHVGCDGLHGFVNDQRRLLDAGARVATDTPQRAYRLEQFYRAKRLDRQLPRDREDYAAAVREATGVGPDEAAEAIARVYRRQVFNIVTPAMAARELCRTDLSPLVASNDPVLLALVAGLSVQRDQWEASFGEAALLTWRKQK